MPSSSSSSKYNEYVRPVLAEFLGQLIFVFLHSSTVHTISVPNGVTGNALLPAISDGLTIVFLIITIGAISGSHVNFAATIAFTLSGKMKLVLVPFYLIAQISGSLAGAGLAFATSGGAFGAFALGPDVSAGQGLLMEFLLTTILMTSVLLAAVELNSVHAAFGIGFNVIINIMAGFNITGGCMNPTLSFGPAVVAGQWEHYWVYWAGPLLGASLAALLFRTLLADKSRLFFHPTPPSPPPSPVDNIDNKLDAVVANSTM